MLYEFAVHGPREGLDAAVPPRAPCGTTTRGCSRALGPDTGFDSIGDAAWRRPLARFLDRLDREGRLAKTILYNLNPRDNELLATMIGNFQDGSRPRQDAVRQRLVVPGPEGRHGAADRGALATMGLLSRFVGMLTDSRSFLSYTRHEYFRRILCNLLGAEMEAGLLPRDIDLVGGMVRDICYDNAARYFGFEGLPEPTGL